jgi:CheY-like chemotaxis protein/signal transduction histidine kinase
LAVSISFRAKLFLLVGTAVLALLAVLVSDSLIAARQSADLANVEGRLIPKLKLAPELETQFERVTRGYRTALTTRDPLAAKDAEHEHQQLLGALRDAEGSLGARASASLQVAIREYGALAKQVSERAIAGESADSLVRDRTHMQALRDQAQNLLRQAARVSSSDVSTAFSTVRDANRRAHRVRLAIGICSFALLVLLSGWLSRSVISAIAELRQGFVRFSSGDFLWRIPVQSNDELGGIAREANQMADVLRHLNDEQSREAWLNAGRVGLSQAVQGDLDPKALAMRSLSFMVERLLARAGLFYVATPEGSFELAAEHGAPSARQRFLPGEGHLGRAALGKDLLVLDRLPDDYLGSRFEPNPPQSVAALPLTRDGNTVALIELALSRECSDEESEWLLSIREMLTVALSAAQSRAALEAQQMKLSQKNLELEQARFSLQQKAEELSKVSSYKSRFLANVSHELRTPLNSMLLLSEHLAKNESGNLTARQVEHAKTVHAAGEDLLSLINQILDLSRDEAVHRDLTLETVQLTHFVERARRVFEPLAAEKGLGLHFETSPDLPPSLYTDRQRVEGILVNLLGNAIKFTEGGKVTLRIARPAANTSGRELDLEHSVSFSVSDTGPGIPDAARARIFAPFEQVDSNTHRRYPGTGLGLAIARESARLLGGDVFVESGLGVGSTFTCVLPEKSSARELAAHPARAASSLGEASGHLLIAVDDPAFAEQLLEIVHARGFEAIVARSGEEALSLARASRAQGMLLDVHLPDIDGWQVMERLREDPITQDLPVYFLSARDSDDPGLALGAVGHLLKPATHDKLVDAVRALTRRAPDGAARVLVVEDDPDEGEALVLSLRRGEIDARRVDSAGAALETLAHEKYACMILDLGLPDMDGLDLLEKLTQNTAIDPPRVIVHTGRALTRAEKSRLDSYAEAVVTKDDSSVTRLLEEIRRFVSELPDYATGEALLSTDEAKPEFSLQGAKLLVAEDDMRTVYAISALLQASGAKVLIADSGREALDVLSKNPDVNGVLMDVMMPELDGYEVIRRLRRDPRFERLPVVALTARAMKGERERCLQAGASDYLAKPVDSQRLLRTVGGLLSSSMHGGHGA